MPSKNSVSFCDQYPRNADVSRHDLGTKVSIHPAEHLLVYESGLYSEQNRRYYNVIRVPFDYICALGQENNNTVVIGAKSLLHITYTIMWVHTIALSLLIIDFYW